MDFFAHGLWTNVVFEAAAQAKGKTRSKRSIWTAVFFGVAPDLLAFGPFLVSNILTSGTLWPYAQARLKTELAKGVASISTSWEPNWLSAPPSPPDPSLIPSYVHLLYGVSHSLLIFAAVFLVVWLIRKAPLWAMSAWGLHIAVDVFSHSEKFFPTPLLFPASEFHLDGISWADPRFMFINYSLLAVSYLWLYGVRRRKRAAASPAQRDQTT